MKSQIRAVTLAALAAAGLCGCLDIRVGVVTKEQALANQVTGVLQDLGEDVQLYESVRGVDDEGKLKTPPKASKGAQKVVAALQSQQFNRDDVQTFLAQGCAGENNQGMLECRENKRCKQDPAYAAFVKAIVAEENADRLVIMKRVIEVSENLSEKDLPDIQKVFAQQNQDAAEPGVWIQRQDGRWERKTQKK